MCISRSAWVKQKIREEFGDENFKEFRNAKKNLRKRSVRGGGKQDDGPDTPKIQQVQGEKDAVLVEALRTYFLNQEQTGWRQVKTPGA